MIDSLGNLYFTDPSYGLAKGNEDPRRELAYNGLFVLHPDGKLVLLDDSVSAPNGIALTPDEKTLILAVSAEDYPVWLAYDIAGDGSLHNKRVFFDARTVKSPGPGVPRRFSSQPRWHCVCHRPGRSLDF